MHAVLQQRGARCAAASGRLQATQQQQRQRPSAAAALRGGVTVAAAATAASAAAAVAMAAAGRRTHRTRRLLPTPLNSTSPDTEEARSPLDAPQEWEAPQPSRRPDIFPDFEKMDRVFLPKPLPGDPEAPDEEAEEAAKRVEPGDPDPEAPAGEPSEPEPLPETDEPPQPGQNPEKPPDQIPTMPE